MSFLTSKTACVAVIALGVTLFSVRSYAAQTVESHTDAVVEEAAEEALHEESESAGPNPLAFRTDLAIWTFVVFVVLFGFLSYFAWPQIAAALDERERKITDNVAAAAAKLEEAKKVLADHEAKLAAAAGDVRAMLDEARRDAEHTRKRIEAEGKQAANDELARAVREINRARDAAVQDLAVTSANVAVDLARGVVRQEISTERQNQIVRDAIGELKARAAAASSN
jgi:F-type H+-transporting ATPase subunit b